MPWNISMNLAAALLAPTLGAHGKVVQLDGAGTSPATITIASSSASGSVFVAPGFSSYGNLNTPTDNKGNTYAQVGSDENYSSGQYPGFGIRTFAAAGHGGSSHTISTSKGLTTGEFSEALIEILNASTVAVTQSNVDAPGQGTAYSSPSITVTAAAVLLSIWAGDGGTNTPDQSVTPSSGWTLLEFSFIGNTAYVQFAVAYKVVSSAGTYSNTWLPTDNQGAAMMMVAVT